MLAWLGGLPAILRFLVYLLVVIIVIVILAWILSAIGGFDWAFHVGKFHWNLGVRGH